MVLGHESILALVESLNGDNTLSISLGISRSDDNELNMASMKKLEILIKAVGHFEKNGNKQALSHEPTIVTNAKTFLGELRPVVFNHRAKFYLGIP